MDKIIVGISGGKDSALCLLLAIKKVGSKSVVALFNDTQWEHPDTYNYIEYLKEIFPDVEWVTTRSISVLEWVEKVGKFPFGKGIFCTGELKQAATRRWMVDYVDWTLTYEFWLGIRIDESVNRKIKYSSYDFESIYNLEDVYKGKYPIKVKNCVKLRLPILNFTKEKVFKEIQKFGIKLNPRYAAGDDRVGCYPCLLSGKKVHNHIMKSSIGKQRIKEIKQVADELGVIYEPLDYDGQCALCKD